VTAAADRRGDQGSYDEQDSDPGETQAAPTLTPFGLLEQRLGVSGCWDRCQWVIVDHCHGGCS
jgi:hypothetical protein